MCCKNNEYNQVRSEFSIICLGLEGSGKSSLLAKLAGESTDNIEPTKGWKDIFAGSNLNLICRFCIQIFVEGKCYFASTRNWRHGLLN